MSSSGCLSELKVRSAARVRRLSLDTGAKLYANGIAVRALGSTDYTPMGSFSPGTSNVYSATTPRSPGSSMNSSTAMSGLVCTWLR